MRLRGDLIVLLFACWKIHVRETAEIGLQHMFLISDPNPNIALVQLFCHQRNSKSQVAKDEISYQFKRHTSDRLVKNQEF